MFILSNICNICNYIREDVDASEEDGLIEELVVVVQQDGSVVHWGETNGRNAHLYIYIPYMIRRKVKVIKSEAMATFKL